MRYSRGTRVVLALLVLIIFIAFSYLRMDSYHVMGTPRAGDASDAEAPVQDAAETAPAQEIQPGRKD